MTIKESKRCGGTQAIKGAAILFFIFELIVLYTQTKGDFANGILFFIDAQLNGIFLALALLHFLIMYVTGRKAGFSLLMQNNPLYHVAIKYGLIVSLVVVLIQSSLLLIFRSHDLYNSDKEIGLTAIRNFFILLIPELPTWLWIGHKIKTKAFAQIEDAAAP